MHRKNVREHKARADPRRIPTRLNLMPRKLNPRHEQPPPTANLRRFASSDDDLDSVENYPVDQ